MGKSIIAKTGSVLTDANQRQPIRGLANEIKVPLLHIKGIAEVLSSGVEDPALIAEQYTRLGLSADRMLQLLDAYLYTEKIVSKQMQLQIQPINVAKIAGQVITSLRPLAVRYDTVLYLQTKKSLHPVSIDESSLRHSLFAMLDVAIRTSKSEAIHVTVQSVKDDVVVIITDDGDPFSGSTISQTTKRLGHAVQPTKDIAAGSGMAVYIAGTLSDSMGAHFEIMQKRGKRSISFSMKKSAQLSLAL